jgi:excisionase family DNA binding protein
MPESTERNEEWFLKLDETCELLRLARPTVKRLILQGELPGRKIGGQWRISSRELGAYLGRTIVRGDRPGDPPRMITCRYPRADPLDTLEPVGA